jgi:hypothetical protein
MSPKGAQLLSPGRQAWDLKANATSRSAEGRRAARSAERHEKIGCSAKRGATWKDRAAVERAIPRLSSPAAASNWSSQRIADGRCFRIPELRFFVFSQEKLPPSP